EMISGGGRLAGIGATCMYSLPDSSNFRPVKLAVPF
ncbi:MAG: hypothetical protein ACI9GB_003102, partial [Halioglobus sp.]